MEKKKQLMALVLIVVCMTVLATTYAYAEPYRDSITKGFYIMDEERKQEMKVNDEVTFGRYEQDKNENDGTEPIEWIVKEIKGDKVLLVSKYVLDCREYNEEKINVTWETSSVRKWLNHDFLKAAFSDEEEAIILEADVPNGEAEQPVKEKWNPVAGKDTKDKVFLLSYPEVLRYFSDIKHTGTKYANSRGAKVLLISKEAGWYTRSSGENGQSVTYIYATKDPSSSAVNSKEGILPAIWVDLSSDWAGLPYQRSQQAEALAEEGKYYEAYEIADELGDFNNSYEKAAEYLFAFAKEAEKQEDYALAVERYKAYSAYADKHSIKIDKEYDIAFPESYNQVALKNLDEKTHARAFELYKELGEYSAEKAAGYWFEYVCKVMDSDDLETAVSLFRQYHDYCEEKSVAVCKEYREALPECYYRMAVQQLNDRQYAKAIELLSNLGQYKDSMALLQKCFDKTHVQYSWLTQRDASLNAGKDNGYSGAQAFAADDPHYGWSLGRFLMSGYTEADYSAGYPTFVKTPGDALVLWFDLNQDIDKLNGNDELSIDNDKKGYYRSFQTQKADTGRGALFVRHTDFRNSTGLPVSYFGYLDASESGVANTRVEVKEEGVYEVALVYRINDSNIKHFFKKTNDYKITFKFAVKNGSSMFYMFDLGTGAELEDYSRTQEGFRIDLANSHSLKIDVVRYALNQSVTGLDVRSSAPASDGDQFDRTGYYEITITNTETGEKLTKHIFIGSRGDLADFKDADSSLALFGEQ